METLLTEENSPLLTVQEVAHILRLSPGAVRSLIMHKEIPAIRLGKQFRIPRHIIDNLLSPLMGQTPEALGYGMWKGKKRIKDSVEYVNCLREKDESKTLDEIVRELHEWEKTFSLTPTS